MEVITFDNAVISWIIFWLTYWIFGSLFTWKGHVTGKRVVTNLDEVVPVLIINMIWTLVGIVLIYFCPLRAMTDSHILIKLITMYVLMDIWFYHVHLMIHHPQIYSKIHKMHHKFRYSYALVALYCTPYEAIILNLFSTSLWPIIFQIPAPYLYIWYFLVAFNTVATHSGMNIPFFIDEHHDNHHIKYTVNYGTSVYFDWLYGTYELPTTDPQESITK